MAEMSRRTKITLEQQAAQCMLCYDAPCTAACGLGADPAAMVRSIRFENLSGAAAAMKKGTGAPHKLRVYRPWILWAFFSSA